MGDWKLGDLLDEGPGWQDFVATRPRLDTQRPGCVHLAGAATTAEEEKRLRRQADREFKVVHDLRHGGIAQPLDLVQADRAPALLFDRQVGEERLDLWAPTGIEPLGISKAPQPLASLCDVPDAAGNPVTVSSHPFGHILATRMLNRGVPQHIVQQMLGHVGASAVATLRSLSDTAPRRAFDVPARAGEYPGPARHLPRRLVPPRSRNGSSTTSPGFSKRCPTANAVGWSSRRDPTRACLTCKDLLTGGRELDAHREHFGARGS